MIGTRKRGSGRPLQWGALHTWLDDDPGTQRNDDAISLRELVSLTLSQLHLARYIVADA